MIKCHSIARIATIDRWNHKRMRLCVALL